MKNTIRNLISVFHIVLSVSIVSCSMADLRSDSIRSGSRESGKELYLKALKAAGLSRWESVEIMRTKGTDIWASWTVRQFTPVHSENQFFESTMQLEKGQHELRLMQEKGGFETIGVGKDGVPYRLNNNQKEKNDEKAIRLYVRPMQNYFEWPFSLRHKSTILKAGERKIGDTTYQLIFITDGDPGPNDETDQYLLYINPQNLQIEMIEFTLREMLDTYSGTLQYSDFRLTDGIRFPWKITVSDSPGDEDYVHEFRLREVRFEQ